WYNVRRFHAIYLDEDPAARESYAAVVEEAMRRDTDSVAPLASELLRLRGGLPPDLVNAVFEDCVRHPGRYQEELALSIIRCVGSLQSGAEADTIRRAAEH